MLWKASLIGQYFFTQQYILSKVVLYALSFPESTESDTSGKAFLS